MKSELQALGVVTSGKTNDLIDRLVALQLQGQQAAGRQACDYGGDDGCIDGGLVWRRRGIHWWRRWLLTMVEMMATLAVAATSSKCSITIKPQPQPLEEGIATDK